MPSPVERPPRLPLHVIDDRIVRYLSGEPIRLIAEDHGVSFESICHTIRRHAPNVAGQRPRGGGPREWPT